MLVRVNPVDLVELRGYGEQMLAYTKFDLAADTQRRAHENIERVVDRAFGGVFDRDDAKIGDTVSLSEGRPRSKRKAWELVSVVERARVR